MNNHQPFIPNRERLIPSFIQTDAEFDEIVEVIFWMENESGELVPHSALTMNDFDDGVLIAVDVDGIIWNVFEHDTIGFEYYS